MTLHTISSHSSLAELESGRALVTAKDLEIENPHKVTKHYWQSLKEFFQEECGIKPVKNTCSSLYIDMRKLELLIKAHFSLRDRPGGNATGGVVYPDQFGLKYTDHDLQRIASRIANHLFPAKVLKETYLKESHLSEKDLGRFFPRIRKEVESRHKHLRNVSEYRFPDLPSEIAARIKDKFGWHACAEMVFLPQLMSVVERRMYTLTLNPLASSQSDLVLPYSSPEEAAAHYRKPYVCIEVALDKCIYRQAEHGQMLEDVVKASKSALRGFGHHRDNKWLVEHEFKAKESSKNLTDRMLINAYMRFMILLYERSIPFVDKDVEPPIRLAGSKAARGYKSKITKGGVREYYSVADPWIYAP